MLINVKVTPRAAKNEVIKIDDANYRVRVTIAPEKGRANQAAIKQLSKYFGVTRSKIKLIYGKTNQRKRFLIA